MTEEGYIFRGWYTDEALTQKARATYTPSADLTFYAKWDAAVTLTFDYNGQGTAAVVVPDKYVGDKVSGIPTVTVTKGEQVFAGWFSLNDTETGEWGEEASTSTVLTGDTTYYAKWIDAVKAYGTYKGWNFYGTSSGNGYGTKAASDLSTTLLTVNADGSYTGKGITAGTLDEAQAQVVDGALILGGGKSYHYFNKALGIVWRSYGSTNATGVGTDTYLAFDVSRVSSVDFSGCDISGEHVGYLKITYVDKSVKYAFLYNNIVVEVGGFKNTSGTAVEAKDIKSTDVVVYTTASAIYAKVVGKTILLNDGKAGSYESGNGYGTIVLDGYGTLTIGENSTSYTLDGNVVSFTLNNAMRKVTLGEGTYTKTLDGYEGTYKLPDGTSTIVLDGYGNADSTKTYVVNGATITIYDGETSTAYGIDVANKLFLGKSIFAGYTFVCSGSSYKLVFDDSSSISGKFISTSYPAYEYGFTGEYSDGVLTLTITSENYNMHFVGSVITATVESGKITFTSSFKYDNTTQINGTSATCEDFVL